MDVSSRYPLQLPVRQERGEHPAEREEEAAGGVGLLIKGENSSISHAHSSSGVWSAFQTLHLQLVCINTWVMWIGRTSHTTMRTIIAKFVESRALIERRWWHKASMVSLKFYKRFNHRLPCWGAMLSKSLSPRKKNMSLNNLRVRL